MSILDTIEKPKDRPPIITIAGDGGLGKTSLAAKFPKPIFIRAEDGMESIPVAHRPDAFPVVNTPDMLWDQLKSLISEDHDYQTLVIDSGTQLEAMFCNYIVESDPKKPTSINQALGGYGNGYGAVTNYQGRVRKACQVLNERKNMTIIFICHAEIENVDLPDLDPYQRYSVPLNKKSMVHYINNVDLVGFLKLETFVMGEDGEKKKAKGSGERLFTCYATPSSIAKNRYGIEEDIIIRRGENALMKHIPFFNQTNQEK